jgi:hypothetical protein
LTGTEEFRVTLKILFRKIPKTVHYFYPRIRSIIYSNRIVRADEKNIIFHTFSEFSQVQQIYYSTENRREENEMKEAQEMVVKEKQIDYKVQGANNKIK